MNTCRYSLFFLIILISLTACGPLTQPEPENMVSLGVPVPGGVDANPYPVVRHQNWVAFLETRLGAMSTLLSREDATFIKRPGLIGDGYVSFEAINPGLRGQYLFIDSDPGPDWGVLKLGRPPAPNEDGYARFLSQASFALEPSDSINPLWPPAQNVDLWKMRSHVAPDYIISCHGNCDSDHPLRLTLEHPFTFALLPPLKAPEFEYTPVWLIELEITVADVADANANDGKVFAQFNLSGKFRLDYGGNDFCRGCSKKFAILASEAGVSFAHDIKYLKLTNDDADGLGITSVKLMLNNNPTPVYQKQWGNLKWIEGNDRYFLASGDELRNYYLDSGSSLTHNGWKWLQEQAYQPGRYFVPCDVLCPYGRTLDLDIAYILEGAIGNEISGEPPHWGHLQGTDYVEVTRTGDSSVHVDLDFEASVTALPDPWVDVDFDAEVQCGLQDGKAKFNITLSNETVRYAEWVDYVEWFLRLSAGFNGLFSAMFLDLTPGSDLDMDQYSQSLIFPTSSCPLLTVTNDGHVLLEFPDADADTVLDFDDNCPNTANADQSDTDGDTVGDRCDNCIDLYNKDQADSDGDGIGDRCDPN